MSDGLAFWRKVGIDPISITIGADTLHTLRCYFSDSAAFLGAQGRIEAFPSERGLARWLAADGATTGHDLARASTWPRIVARARAGELVVEVDAGADSGPYLNSYHPAYLAELLAEGSCEADPGHVANVRELLTDVAEWAGDDKARRMLADSHPLGRLLSRLSEPDPRSRGDWHPWSRVPPREAVVTEAAQLRELIDDMRARFRVHPDRRPWS